MKRLLTTQRTALSRIAFVLVILSTSSASELHGETIRVAVASNFAPVVEMLAQDYETLSGHTLQISQGSSGRHYAQIRRGAPFDVFLSADLERPRRLQSEGRVVALAGYSDDVVVYARGRLVLWHGHSLPQQIADAPPALEQLQFTHFAIANPRLAPYGHAANQVIEILGWGPIVEGKLVTGENVAQAYQYLYSGAAEAGLVAYSQVLATKREITAAQGFWLVPEDLHSPIEQALAVLRDSPAVLGFVDFLLGENAQSLIAARGYSKPPKPGQ